MNANKKIPFFIKENRYFLFRYIPICFLVFLVAFMLLRFPESAGQGISDGIDICLGTLIPSLYPFMVLSSFLVNSTILGGISKVFERLTMKLFALPGICAGTIIMSVIGGFPVGGKMIQNLYEGGEISRSQAQRMLLFCINPGPAFVISTVGLYMLGSKYVGGILFLTQIISVFIMAILSRFFCNEDNYYLQKSVSDALCSPSLAIVNSVTQASISTLSVCAWVLLFSCIMQLIDILPLCEEIKFFSCCILEVTNACLYSCGTLSLPIVAGIIAFGGICVHCQIMSAIIKTTLKLKFFYTARVLHTGIAIVVCQALLYIFPISQQTVTLGVKPSETASISVPVSIFMLFSCILFLLGDSFKIRIKKKSK